MFDIKISFLPPKLTGKQLKELEEGLIAAAVSIDTRGYAIAIAKEDLKITFLSDLKYPHEPAREILVEITKRSDLRSPIQKPFRRKADKVLLERIGEVVNAHFPPKIVIVKFRDDNDEVAVTIPAKKATHS